MPGFIGATALLVHQYQEGRRQLEQQTVQTARALVQAIDNRIFRVQALAQGLASISVLAQGDFAGFHEQARETLRQADLGLAVILTDASGQQHLNTLRELGDSLPRSGAPEISRRVFETGKPTVSHLFVGATIQQYVLVVGVPVFIDGKVAYALTVPILPTDFNALLAEQKLPPDWVATVLDSSATIVARTRANDQFVGKKPRPEYVERFLSFNEQVYENTTLEGIAALVTFVRSRDTGWGIGIAYPLASSQAPLIKHIAILAIGLGALSALCLVLAWYIAKKIARSFQSIRVQATALGAGTPVPVPVVDVLEAEEATRAIGQSAKLLEERQAALRVSEERFRLLADNIAQLAWMADENGLAYWYNQRWYDYTGTTLEEMRGWGWQKVHHPDHGDRVLAKIRHCFDNGEPWEDTFPLRGADGEYRWFLSRAIPVRDASGKVARWFGTHTDITERMQQEVMLQESEAKFRTIADAIPQIIWSTLPDGYHDYYNRRWHEVTGVPEGSTDGEEWNAMFHPDDQQRAWKIWRHSLETGEPYEIEYRLRYRSGEYRWVLGRALPVRDKSGAIVRWMGTCTDVHDAKQAQAEVLRLNAELEQRVDERTAELKAANQELEGFTFATSHDLRGPLGRINSFATLLERNCQDQLKGENLLFLSMIRQNASRLTQLVDNLLAHARVAQHTLELRPLDITSMAQAVIREKAQEAGDTKVEIRMDLPPIKVMADSQALDQVLSNLVENAMKYSSKVTSPLVEIGGEPVGDRFRFWVRDNGVGFDMKYHDKIFQMFQRLHTYTEYTGSGVGLALVKRAVERMGGKVWAESEPGKGATFFLELQTVTVQGGV